MQPLDRFTAKYEVSDDGCWLWKAGKSVGGYGRFNAGKGQIENAHRWAYEHFVGPIPAGLQLDHLCRVRHCVNPAHLEPVTLQENIARGTRHPYLPTHCSRGHPFDDANTYRYAWRGGMKRACRTCHRWYRQQRRIAKAA